MKGFLPFTPLAFTRVPPDATISKACEDSKFGNYVGHCVYKIGWFISVKKSANSGYVVDVFFLRKFNRILRNSIGQPKTEKPFRFPTRHYREGVGGVALGSES